MNAIITGATQGIGKAIALKFAKHNINLCVCARKQEGLDALVEEITKLNPSVLVKTQTCDVSIKNEVIAFSKFCLDAFDKIDILINNAGFFMPGDIHTEEEGLLEKMLDTNLMSAYHLSRKIIPQLKKQQEGLIVNISSVAGLQAYPQGGSYSISKFALSGFSQNLRGELKEDGIKVSTVYPGATYSASWDGSGVDEERIMAASDIAESIYSLTQLSKRAVVEDIILRPLLGDL
jgi:short-subunit dehydrogenase